MSFNFKPSTTVQSHVHRHRSTLANVVRKSINHNQLTGPQIENQLACWQDGRAPSSDFQLWWTRNAWQSLACIPRDQRYQCRRTANSSKTNPSTDRRLLYTFWPCKLLGYRLTKCFYHM